MSKSEKVVSREEFDAAIEAIWEEIKYQDSLPRRTEDEAKDVPGFLTLGRRYIRQSEDDWADNAGCEKSEHGLRKLSAIFVRGMVYTNVRRRF